MIYITLGIFTGVIKGIYQNIYPFIFFLLGIIVIYIYQHKSKKYSLINILLLKIRIINICIYIIFMLLSYLYTIKYIEKINKVYEIQKDKNYIVFDVLKIDVLEDTHQVKKKKKDNVLQKKILINIYKIDDKIINKKVNLYTKKNLKIGNRYETSGKLQQYEENFNPGDFNKRIYNYSKGIIGNIEIEENTVKSIKRHIDNLIDIYLEYNIFIYKYMDKIYTNFNKYSKSKLVIGVILGDVSGVEKNIVEDFKNTNIYHMLSVSGSHIVTIILLLELVTKKLPSKFKILMQIIILIVFSYLVQNTPAVVRAVSMYIMLNICKLLKLDIKFLNILLFSYIFNIAINPYQITNIGIYLSYVGAYSIYICMQILNNFKYIEKINFKITNIDIQEENNFFKKIYYKFISYIVNSFIISFVVQIFIFPIIAKYFQSIYINFFLANILVGFALDLVVIFGFILIILSVINIEKIVIIKYVAIGIGSVIDIIIKYIILITKYISKFPVSVIYVIPPTYLVITLYYLLLIFVILFLKKYINIQEGEN